MSAVVAAFSELDRLTKKPRDEEDVLLFAVPVCGSYVCFLAEVQVRGEFKARDLLRYLPVVYGMVWYYFTLSPKKCLEKLKKGNIMYTYTRFVIFCRCLVACPIPNPIPNIQETRDTISRSKTLPQNIFLLLQHGMNVCVDVGIILSR